MSKMNLPYESECKLECLKCGSFYRDWIEFAKCGTVTVALCPACNCVSKAYVHYVQEVIK